MSMRIRYCCKKIHHQLTDNSAKKEALEATYFMHTEESTDTKWCETNVQSRNIWHTNEAEQIISARYDAEIGAPHLPNAAFRLLPSNAYPNSSSLSLPADCVWVGGIAVASTGVVCSEPWMALIAALIASGVASADCASVESSASFFKIEKNIFWIL